MATECIRGHEHVAATLQMADGRTVDPSKEICTGRICEADSLRQLKALETLKELEFFAFSSFFVARMMLQFLYEQKGLQQRRTE